MIRMLGWIVSLAALAALSGCIVHRDGYGRLHTHATYIDQDGDGPDPDGQVFGGHECRHNDDCGHYWHNGNWYGSHGHAHRAGCGHYYHSGRWVLAGAVVVKTGHTCSNACNHYHHDGRWYAQKAHVHGAGCGHRLQGGVWIGIKW